jgi:hypothetical protein
MALIGSACATITLICLFVGIVYYTRRHQKEKEFASATAVEAPQVFTENPLFVSGAARPSFSSGT